jgi:enterochelin esterase family protein
MAVCLLVLARETRADAAHGTVSSLSIHYTKERRVWVYTPPQYDVHSKTGYDLLVLFDGESYTSDIPAPAILDNLIATKQIRPIVAVMVDTSENRLGDLANHQRFADFAATELVPWARTKWRIATGPSHVVVGGYSAGGLAAAYVAFRHPEVFGNVLSQSGAFWRGNEGTSTPGEWLTEQFTKSPRLKLRFYLEVGAQETQRVGGGVVFVETNQRLRDVLRAKGYPVTYVEVPGAQHEETHWRAAFPQGLVHFFARTDAARLELPSRRRTLLGLFDELGREIERGEDIVNRHAVLFGRFLDRHPVGDASEESDDWHPRARDDRSAVLHLRVDRDARIHGRNVNSSTRGNGGL